MARQVAWEPDGTFHLDAVPLGRYALALGQSGRWRRLRTWTIAATSDGELGDVALPRFGRLVVRSTYDRWFTVSESSGKQVMRLRAFPGSPTRVPLPCGDYEVAFLSPQLRPDRRQVVVEPEQVAPIQLPHAPGRPCIIRFSPEETRRSCTSRLTVKIVGDGDACLASLTAPFNGREWLHEVRLAPGTYRVTAQLAGLGFTRRVTVSASEQNDFLIRPTGRSGRRGR